MRKALASIVLIAPSLCAFQVQGTRGKIRKTVIVEAFTGRTESDDCLIFKTNKGEFYIYDVSFEGMEYVKLLKTSLDKKRPVILVLDPDLKGYVQGVLPLAMHPKRLTLRSTRTLPLRGTVLDRRSDFPSLTNRAASAAPVSSHR